MELRLLTTFLKVAQLQSFSKAAESLGYSQSAVTVQVQQLENELGVRLFDRIGKTVSITHYGQEFIPYARDVVSAAARAVSFTVAGARPDRHAAHRHDRVHHDGQLRGDPAAVS